MEATEDYRREEDILGRFLNECTIPKQGAKARAKELYRAYVQWCEENGITCFCQLKRVPFVDRKGYHSGHPA